MHTAEELSKVLKVLADPTRLTMLKQMQDGEQCACSFVDCFDISQPAISRHLKMMRQAGLLLERRDKQWIHYRLNEASPFYSIVVDLLGQVEMIDASCDCDAECAI
ncbi:MULTISPECIES: helix-turn-helix transcriptional regulator [Exiguobacterium]|uniref:ArsR/SmtB family transcription factor n=1 Tax=Exiguobacterium TaxID=33986 RepID=UPI00087793A1|nr:MULTISPECIES: metalloregulator ArsR/SmtB family transcription factor [Exiguobacterium]TCI27176.1 ArsR family transcriptional regulator [Exiguobacterium sp. SH5S4]TCI48136.1 ArsR family transcriptional regulator [Exiguobacterium sp. SH5S32]TCI51250.1 ArsR family transcriptional regulator [Exiguobacterium sp. SH5S13]TCI55021.1 ArsR family transcriptional regulator [Exiguobacterium sp. SH1S4]TCI63031.1 ArsR family transcriptional regulator [Exiguobacterium sp. SH0S2]